MLTFGSCAVPAILLDERIDGGSQHTKNKNTDMMVVDTLLVNVDAGDDSSLVTTEVGAGGVLILTGQTASSCFDPHTPNGRRGPPPLTLLPDST